VKYVQIVVTSGSGAGRARHTAHGIRRALARRGRISRVLVFPQLEALQAWAGRCGPTFSHLVCVGGDATLSAAAAAALRCRVPFIPVPNGFGNVFARVFGHPHRAHEIVRLLEDGEERTVDVGLVGDELFLSHRSYGVLERIQQGVERGGRQPRGRMLRLLAYLGRARRLFSRRSLPAIRVEVDGALVAEDAVLVTAANVETYRGFLSLTPGASPLDGKFDVFVVPRTSRAGVFWRLLRIALGLPGRWRGVVLCRGEAVAVTTARGREELRVARRALALVVPRGSLEALRRRTADAPASVAEIA
jgi:diacylglycerol kinase (ATP)